MKSILLFYTLFSVALASLPQNQKKIQKSWVKISVENFSDRPIEEVAYMRYTFGKNKVHVSFNPAWDTYTLDWSLSGNNVTVGISNYAIEELTDTSLVIYQEGFNRVKFLSEEYLNSKENNLQQVGEINGKPFYKANEIVTARYEKSTSLTEVLSKNTSGYNIKSQSYFLLTFVVTEEGEIENIKVENSIAEGYDAEVIKNLLKTSKDWKPAYYKGKPVATQMCYDIKYLKSTTPFSAGNLH